MNTKALVIIYCGCLLFLPASVSQVMFPDNAVTTQPSAVNAGDIFFLGNNVSSANVPSALIQTSEMKI